MIFCVSSWIWAALIWDWPASITGFCLLQLLDPALNWVWPSTSELWHLRSPAALYWPHPGLYPLPLQGPAELFIPCRKRCSILPFGSPISSFAAVSWSMACCHSSSVMSGFSGVRALNCVSSSSICPWTAAIPSPPAFGFHPEPPEV